MNRRDFIKSMVAVTVAPTAVITAVQAYKPNDLRWQWNDNIVQDYHGFSMIHDDNPFTWEMFEECHQKLSQAATVL